MTQEGGRTGQGQDEDEGTRPLSGLAVSNVLWQGLSFVLGRGFTLAATVILARLLVPADFGLVGLAIVFIAFADNVSDLGVGTALVYFKRDPRNDDAALMLCLASGVVLCVVGILAAPIVAGFFDRPEVAPMFRVMSATLLLSTVRQVPVALLRRELAGRKLLVLEIARASAQGAFSVGLALAGAGAWAIIWGYVASGVAGTVAAWMLAGYRPRGGWHRLSRPVAQRLLGYGGPAAAQGLLAALIFDVDYVIVGRVFGAEALGIYALAFRLPQLLIINVFFILSTVAFPIFALARDDPDRLKRGYLTSVRLQSTYGVAAGVGLFMVAPFLVPVVFGPKWQASIVPLEALSLYAAGRSLGTGAVDVYKGIGRVRLAASVAAVRLALLVPALLVAARESVNAVAWTQAAVAVAFACGMQAVASRIVGVSVVDLATAMRPALAAAAGTALGAGAVRWGVPGPDGIRLVAALTAGAAGGLSVVWLVDADFVRDMRALIFRRQSAPAAVAPA